MLQRSRRPKTTERRRRCRDSCARVPSFNEAVVRRRRRAGTGGSDGHRDLPASTKPSSDDDGEPVTVRGLENPRVKPALQRSRRPKTTERGGSAEPVVARRPGCFNVGRRPKTRRGEAALTQVAEPRRPSCCRFNEAVVRRRSEQTLSCMCSGTWSTFFNSVVQATERWLLVASRKARMRGFNEARRPKTTESASRVRRGVARWRHALAERSRRPKTTESLRERGLVQALYDVKNVLGAFNEAVVRETTERALRASGPAIAADPSGRFNEAVVRTTTEQIEQVSARREGIAGSLSTPLQRSRRPKTTESAHRPESRSSLVATLQRSRRPKTTESPVPNAPRAAGTALLERSRRPKTTERHPTRRRASP